MRQSTILVVEDERPMRLILTNVFTKAGFKVFEAMEGESGLKIALAEHPDFILLDLLMPKMDGMKMLQELRGTEWGREARVAILTNFSNPERVNEAMANNVGEFWIKTNWTLANLVKKVKKDLNSSQ